MNVLNWKQDFVSIQMDSHSQFENLVVLRLDSSKKSTLIQEWIQNLDELLEHQSNEFRMDLPAGWTFYFKLREGESRQLVAHPDKETWVATFALTPSHARSLREKAAQNPQGIQLSEPEPIFRMSNLDLRIE